MTNPDSTIVKYVYDAYGRVTKVGAGSTAATDPTEYTYSTTTGLMTKARYYSGANYSDALYAYDNGGRLTSLDDWMSSVSGETLRYTYDDAGRLLTLTDYDGDRLRYVYDSAGNVITMTDYYGAVTTYTYTAANQLSTVATSGKTWNFSYNPLGQPTQYTHPNGLTTAYSYDAGNRLSKIEHKDGATVKESYTYTLSTAGNIDSITMADGSDWVYQYDGRYRLTRAERNNSGDTITGVYTYAYDDGDNLLSKTEPFLDDFNDGNMTGWSVYGIDATERYAKRTVVNANWHRFHRPQSNPNVDLRFSYSSPDLPGTGYRVYVHPRYVDSNNWIAVFLYPEAIKIVQKVNGGGYQYLAQVSMTTTQNAWYDVRIVCDGSNITVWRGEKGGAMAKIITTSAASVTTSATLIFQNAPYSDYRFDDIQLVGGSLSNVTTTYGYDAGNKMTTMSLNGVSTTFGYDAWGRMTGRTANSVTTKYAYRYGDKLYSVDLTNDGTADVTYDYGGDGKLRTRTAGGVSEYYRYGDKETILNEEDSQGNLTRRYVGVHAYIENSIWSYLYYSATESAVMNQNKEILGESENVPNGELYSKSGISFFNFSSMGEIAEHAAHLNLTATNATSNETGQGMGEGLPGVAMDLKTGGLTFKVDTNADGLAYISYTIKGDLKCDKVAFSQNVRTDAWFNVFGLVNPEDHRWHQDITKPDGYTHRDSSSGTRSAYMFDSPLITFGGTQYFVSVANCCRNVSVPWMPDVDLQYCIPIAAVYWKVTTWFYSQKLLRKKEVTMELMMDYWNLTYKQGPVSRMAYGGTKVDK